MLIKLAAISIHALVLLFTVVFAEVGNKCILKSTGQEGLCKLSSDCLIVEEQAKRGIEATLCGFYELNTPIVCCPRGYSNPEPNNLDLNPIVFPEDNLGPEGYFPIFDERIRISQQKCREYSKTVTEVVSALPLIPNAEPINIKVDKCDYNSVPLIVGGEPASAGEFPFMAAIGFNVEEDNQKWRCGGTLISDRYVLTAAHCTASRDAGPPVVVRLGDLNLLSTNDGAQPKDYEIEKIIIHDQYNYPLKYNDVALLRTKRTVVFNKFIRPACLHSKEIRHNSAVATGWGKTDFAADSSDRLMKVTLNIYPNHKCSKTYRDNTKELPRGIVSSMICAGELDGGKDTCQGDSGGPLVITKKGNQCIFYVIGVTSFGKSCGQRNTPAIYTKVSEYLDWIEKTIWD